MKRYLLAPLLITVLAGCNNGDDGLLGGSTPDSPDTNVAPEAQNVDVTPLIDLTSSSVLLQLDGQYYDADDDAPDAHTFRWLKDGNEIADATQAQYRVDSDFTSTYAGCVTPVALTGVKVGEEMCAPVSDVDILPPQGAAVPSATPTITGETEIGNTITTSYIYNPEGGSAESSGSIFYWLVYEDPSLPTKISCEAQAEVPCSLEVSNAYNGRDIQSCVLPQNQDGVYGAVNCTSTTIGLNTAPRAENVAVWPTNQVLAIDWEYQDSENDPQSVDGSQFSWKLDGEVIEGATQPTYLPQVSELDRLYMGCVKPIAETGIIEGEEVCAPVTVNGTIVDPSEIAPSAVVTINGLPLLGQTINASYVYDDEGSGISEGESPFAWLLFVNGEGSAPKVQRCESSAPCDLTITKELVDVRVEACVEPVNADGLYGTLDCAATTGIASPVESIAVVQGVGEETQPIVNTNTYFQFRVMATLANGQEDVDITTLSEFVVTAADSADVVASPTNPGLFKFDGQGDVTLVAKVSRDDQTVSTPPYALQVLADENYTCPTASITQEGYAFMCPPVRQESASGYPLDTETYNLISAGNQEPAAMYPTDWSTYCEAQEATPLVVLDPTTTVALGTDEYEVSLTEDLATKSGVKVTQQATTLLDMQHRVQQTNPNYSMTEAASVIAARFDQMTGWITPANFGNAGKTVTETALLDGEAPSEPNVNNQWFWPGFDRYEMSPSEFRSASDTTNYDRQRFGYYTDENEKIEYAPAVNNEGLLIFSTDLLDEGAYIFSPEETEALALQNCESFLNDTKSGDAITSGCRTPAEDDDGLFISLPNVFPRPVMCVQRP